MNWTLLTSSFGADAYHDAARRVLNQAKSFGLFSRVVHLNETNLGEYTPKTLAKYESYLSSDFRGFGYFSWKAEAVEVLLKRNSSDGVLYVDAGCELNKNAASKIRLSTILRSARQGHFFHTLDYPERLFTKKKTLDFFSLTPAQRMSPQIQATWFALSGNLGLSIAEKWSQGVLTDIELINDSISNEDLDFIEHRHDQSILSCTLKTMGVNPRRHRPCHRPQSSLSKLNCHLHPIWSARNRSGASIIKAKKV